MEEQKCKKCFKIKDISEFDLRYDGTPFYICKGCNLSYLVERKKKSFAVEVAVKREKGRQLRKLTEVQCAEIREKRAEGATLAVLAIEFGVSPSTISKVATSGYSKA